MDQLTESIGIVLNNIETNTRTEELLSQSQSLASELSAQQEELRRANDELHDKGRSLEEKAEQLTLTSKYKSEFPANMSHELRTPLNSLLILAQQLFENPEGNLTEKQRMFAKTIHSCGDDLIQLINDILDLSKIESGVIAADVMPVSFKEITAFAESTFKPISEAKNLKFEIDMEDGLPELMETDMQRLNQILKNLLSNAFKFTEKGRVKLSIFRPAPGQKTRLVLMIRLSLFLLKIQVLVFLKTPRVSSSKPSSRPKVQPVVNTAVPAWGCLSVKVSPNY
ncbi:sensor histidine kinase [Mucilaginibacter humi]|uniref:sensor histidine kinase n=1 Tax=Mucilaginibacter humi TaxID=2732510 RepID=UPI001C2E7D89|nr:histidine kinase dimerization/phospho-acceptor domain-containing protein [Mucilaginibacter humi]